MPAIRSLLLTILLLGTGTTPVHGTSPEESFRGGVEAFNRREFTAAAKAFAESVAQEPAAGALQDLGLAEWSRNRIGPAVQAWEQVLLLEPFNEAARMNLRFARKTAQLEAPESTWYEVASMWLPADWWAWIAGVSFWFAVGMATLPGFLRRRIAAWQQALAAAGLVVFLFSIPAQVGVHTRSHIGFVLDKGTPLRLTPTREAQVVTLLAPGEPARWKRSRGNYIFVRTSHAAGWLEKPQLGLVCPQ
jgi:hypothetical protein